MVWLTVCDCLSNLALQEKKIPIFSHLPKSLCVCVSKDISLFFINKLLKIQFNKTLSGKLYTTSYDGRPQVMSTDGIKQILKYFVISCSGLGRF